MRWVAPWLALLAASCGAEQEPADVAPEPTAGSAPTRWVEVRAPEDRSILEAPAVARVEGAVGEVAAPARVRVVGLRVRAGTTVRAGDPIVDVTSTELVDAAARRVAASRALGEYTTRAEAIAALRADGLATRAQEFELRSRVMELAAERDRADATLRSAGVEPRAARRLARRGSIPLVAPVDGVVVQLRARVGETVEPGDEALARILGEGPARIEVRTTRAWPAASGVVFEADDGREVALDPTPLASIVDPADGTRASWYATSEPIALPDGLVGRARVTAADDVWEVPVTAVTQRTGRSELVRRRADGEVERVAVEVLGSSGASALVRGPLAAGDRVAADETERAEATP